MDDKEKRDFFETIKRGALWHSDKITDELRKMLYKQSGHFGISHEIRWDADDKFHYIYDNECYLFVFNDLIELRSDRENVFSSHQTIKFPIESANDIGDAYEKFVSMTREDEE